MNKATINPNKVTPNKGYYDWLYDKPPKATLEQVESVILEGGTDCDGITRDRWIEELKSEDLFLYLLTEILENKDNPAYRSLYTTVRDHIEGILYY